MRHRQLKLRFISLLALLALVVGLLPISALAARIDPEDVQMEAPADAPLELTDAAPADAADAVELLAATADASGSVKNAAYSEEVDTYEIYPVPHSVVYEGAAGSRTPFTMTTDVNVVADAEVDTYTTDFLKELLTRFGHNMTITNAAVDGKTNIVLSIHDAETPSGDAVSPDTFTDLWTATDKYDPYILKADASSNSNGVITIIGKDTDCVYYGVATLQMMFTSFNGEKFYPVQIEDYANTALRGFIEGFYAGFDYDGRASQIRSIRDVKGNMYVFSSKTDSYHGGSNWSTLYSDEELAKISELVEIGKTVKVDYTWSIHIGLQGGKVLDGIDNNSEGDDFLNEDVYNQRLTAVQNKFQQLYNAGVRNFHILNDDQNSGTYRVQVKFLNDMNAWLKNKGCGPLVYCCMGYNKGWAEGGYGGGGAELAALRQLDSDIYLYWTGNAVNAPMTQESVSWPRQQSNHQVVTWLNYPCSEHDEGTGIYLGDISYYVSNGDGLTGQYGFLSNAISAPEANKVAYFQLLSWCWNRDHYTDYLEPLWEDCFKYLQPEVYEAYLTIARNVSNCPKSTRVGPFPESEYLKDTLERVQAALLAGDTSAVTADVEALKTELDHILAAVDIFPKKCTNEALVAELTPWLNSLRDVAVAGKQGILAAEALSGNDISAAWNAFAEGSVALGQWDTYISITPGLQNPVKAGSRRLQPFANAVLNYVETAMAEEFNPGGGLGGVTPIIRLAGQDRPDNDNARKMLDGNASTYASYESGCVQEADDYYGVDLGGVKLISAVDILQGKNDTDQDYFHKAALEISTDGKNWTTLVTKVNSRHIQVDGLNLAARYVRLHLVEIGYTKDDYWTHIREFTVTEKSRDLLYTNVSEPDGVTAEADGGVYTLTVPSLTLAEDKYVGIKLPEIVGIKTVSAGALPSGVTLQYSASGQNWTSGAPTQTTAMGYIRLVNTGSEAVTLTGITLTAIEPVRTQLSFVSGNPSANWANVVDGDRSTYTNIRQRQEYGQYAIFYLGGSQAVQDVTIVVPDSVPPLENTLDIPHNLDFFVGNSPTANGSWNKIGELRSKNANGEDIPANNLNDIRDTDYENEPPYRTFTVNGGGIVGRYLKVAIADVTSFRYYWINELEVNTEVTQEEPLTAVSASSGTAANADDGNLLTFCTPEAGAGHWEKLLQEPTEFTGVTVLRGAQGSNATVKVQKGNAWTQVGTLTKTATPIDLSGQGAITGLRIEWEENDEPSIAEVIFAGETAPTGDGYVLQPNIYEQPANPAGVTVANGTALANVNLPATVQATMSDGSTAAAPVTWSCDNYNANAAGTYTFTGAFTGFNPGCFSLTATVTVEAPIAVETENLARSRPVYVSGMEVNNDFFPEEAVDGVGGRDENSRWSSNYMKVLDGASNGSNPAWIVVDLGCDVTSVNDISIQYYKKVWPENYVIQVAGSDYTPQTFVTINDQNRAEGNVGTVAATHAAFSGQHAQNVSCWKTVKTFTGQSLSDYPTNTVSAAELTAVSDLPNPIRYVRLYFTRMNNSAGGHAIGLTELTVNGTRMPAPTGVTVSSATGSATANLVTNGTNTVQLSAAVAPAAAYQGVTWRSNNTNVATVDENGLVTAVGDGSTTIAATALGGTGLVSGGYQVNVRTAATGVTVTKTDDTALTNNTVRVYTNTDLAGHDHSITLKGNVTPGDATNKALNWTRPDGAQGMISVARVGTGATATITAVAGETNVGEVTVEVASDSDPTVKTSFKVQVFRALENGVTISGDAKYGSTLTADTNQLVMTPAGKAALTYQWKRNGTAISGVAAKAKTYTLTEADIGAIISVDVTASEATFYEGTKTAALTEAVALADGPAAPDGLLGVKCTTAANNDGKITGFPNTGDDIYEYKLRDDPDEAAYWTAVDANATQVTGLAHGNYQVRIKATTTRKAGAIRNVTVGAYNATLYPITVGSHTNGALTRDPAQAEEDATVTLTVTPDPGYALVENGLSVVKTASGDPVAYEAAGDNTYTFRMPAEAVTVSAAFQLTKVHITHALTDLTCTVGHEDENVHTVDWGSVQTITLTAAEGFDLPATVTITKAGGAAFTAYTYNNGVITFNGGGLTEDVTITAAGVKKTYQVAYTVTHGLTAPNANAPRTVKHKEAYTGTLEAAEGYRLPLGITVTMGGETFTDFTYNSGTGLIDIAAGKITGNLAITAAGLDAAVPVVLATGVTLDQNAASLKVNGKVTLIPTVTPEEATEKGVVWSSSDNSIATVSADGVVTAVAPGTATITVTTIDGGFAAPCVVTVTKASSSGGGSPAPSETTTTETRDDGTTVTTVTKPDGSKTQTVEHSDGTKSELVATKDGDVTITVTDPEGEEIVKTELPAKLPEPELTFEDVPETHWAQEAIKHMVGLGLAKGVGGNQYDAAVPMSRGALATVLHRLSNGQKDYDVTFKDVAETKFYAPGVAWAAKAGVVTGYNADIFAPEDIITREQLAVMLARYAKLIGMNTKADAKALDKFNDGQNTGSWAVDGMAWCVENGIIQGKDGNRLDPTTNVSRAEVAVMLDRFIELLK